MNERKRKNIEEQLAKIEKRLANAEEYLEKNVNVKGDTFLHLGDWQGKSGHPLWMRNVMVPATIEHRAKKEKTLEKLEIKAIDKTRTKLRRAAKRGC